jgi:desulfoferrodoxin (superoxide reductase-like protein)
LVSEDIDAGRRLIGALERAGLPIAVAAWLKKQEDDTWALYIATPDVEKHGPIVVYTFINKIIGALKEARIGVGDVVAANTTNHFVNAISSIVQLAPDIGIRLAKVTLFGVPVDEAFVYKVQRGVKASPMPPRVTSEIKKKALAAA